MTDPSPNDAPGKTFTETIEVAGGQLIDKVKDLIKSGNVRTLRIRAGEDFSLEMSMTVGVIAGGVVVLTAPWLAVLGVIAAMVTHVKIEVEREKDEEPAMSDTPADATTEKTDA
jgi:hypothetical protein